MAKTLAQVLSAAYLTGIIQSPEGGVPQVFDDGFFTLTKPIDSNVASFGRVGATRQLAPTVNYGSPSRKVGQEDTVTVNLQCVHAFTHMDHKPQTLMLLKSAEQRAIELGATYVERQAVEYRRRFDNLRIAGVCSMLRYGALYFDGNGNLLPTSSGVVQTVDLGVPAANKDQLGGVIAASWAVAGTDILGHLAALQLAAVQRSGRPIKTIYYGSSIVGYLAANTAVKEIMKSDAALTSALRQNKIPDGFGIEGVVWKPLYTSFYKDSTGTNQTWFPGDFIVAIPEVTRDWYEMIEGGYLVPNSTNVSSDVAEALANLDGVNGMFSYAKTTDDPPGVRQFGGDTFLPALYDPNSVFIGDTVP